MKLPPRHRLEFAAKVAITVCAEVMVAPPLIVGALLLEGSANEKLLALQNKLRQRALLWLFPEVEPKR